MTTLIVALVSSTLFFLLGVMVGREYTIRGERIVPSENQVKGSSMIPSSSGTMGRSGLKEGKGQKKVDITFYDQLMRERDQELNREVVKGEGAGNKGKKCSRSTIKKAHKGEEAVQKQERREPSPLVKVRTSNSGSYALQVAAFRHKTFAKEMARKLQEQGFPVHILRGSSPGGPRYFYRVWVGYFQNLSEAMRARTSLLKRKSLRISRVIIIKR